jgi:hypothetical protein
MCAAIATTSAMTASPATTGFLVPFARPSIIYASNRPTAIIAHAPFWPACIGAARGRIWVGADGAERHTLPGRPTQVYISQY